jgi:DNA-binding FadR family transcriptional regulator
MANILGVNRSSLRESLRALQLLGVIDVKHGYGTFVRGFNFDAVWNNLSYEMIFNTTELKEVLQVRTHLEAAFIHEVADRLTEEQMERLQKIHRRMVKKAQNGEQIIDEDEEFHTTLFENVENAFLKRLLAIFWQTVKQMKQHVAVLESDLEGSVNRHGRILQCLSGNDLAGLSYHVLHHNDSFLDRVQKIINNCKENGDAKGT